jgi:hypothetical protein
LGPDRPKVSVVTVFHNRAAQVARSVRSLLDQSYPSLEIIAVDDGSTDGTAAELARFSGPGFRLIAKENSGLTDSLRLAIGRASGEYIAIHGAGDESLPDRIARQVALLEADAGVGLVGCWVETRHGSGKTDCHRHVKRASLADTIFTANPFSHGEVTFRRSVYDRVGGYRTFFEYAQDRDLWVRMSAHTDFAVVPEMLYRRFHTSDSVSASAERVLRQAFFADFALECGRRRDAEGRDPLDRGEAPAPDRPMSAAVSRYCLQKGLYLVLHDEVAEGCRLLRAATEAWTPLLAQPAGLIIATHKVPAVWTYGAAPVLRLAHWGSRLGRRLISDLRRVWNCV